jgi:hypothetical protein
MRRKILLFSAVMISALNFAQETPSRIKVYTPSGASNDTKSSKDNSYRWAVKTDIFGIISGEFPVIAEYRFAPKFSVEASAGVTYAYIPNDFLSTNDDDVDYVSGDENTKAGIGSAFRGTIKFYPSSDYDAIEGWNFGIQLFSKTTNREYNSSGNGEELLNGLKDSKTKTGVSLIIGKQIFQDSNVTFESFIGIGFANVKREYSTITSFYDTSDNYAYEVQTKTLTESKPNLQLGFRIGFGN